MQALERREQNVRDLDDELAVAEQDTLDAWSAWQDALEAARVAEAAHDRALAREEALADRKRAAEAELAAFADGGGA
jgi:hypothetical protein